VIEARRHVSHKLSILVSLSLSGASDRDTSLMFWPSQVERQLRRMEDELKTHQGLRILSISMATVKLALLRSVLLTKLSNHTAIFKKFKAMLNQDAWRRC